MKRTGPKTPDMLLVEARDPKNRDIARILRDTYAAARTCGRTGERLNPQQDASTIWRWMRRLGMEIRETRVVRRRTKDEPAEVATP